MIWKREREGRRSYIIRPASSSASASASALAISTRDSVSGSNDETYYIGIEHLCPLLVLIDNTYLFCTHMYM
jgi:hypothetical protein